MSRRSAASTSRLSSPTSSAAGGRPPRRTATAGSSNSSPGWSTRASCARARWPGCAAARARGAADVSRDGELERLLATARGPRFEDRRDAALIRVFLDTGARLAEVAGLRSGRRRDRNDVDLDQGILRVLGKGRRERVVAVGSKTVRALDRYSASASARHTPLCRGCGSAQGRLTDSGIPQILRERDRAGSASVSTPTTPPHVRPSWLAGGGGESELMAGRLAEPGDADRYGAAPRPSAPWPLTGGSRLVTGCSSSKRP